MFRAGDEPDPRFTLANERTLLAWVRTALALVAGGVALEALDVPLEPRARLAASVTCLLMGTALLLVAWAGWVRTERALRLGQPLPAGRAGTLLTVGVSAVALVVLLGLLVPAAGPG